MWFDNMVIPKTSEHKKEAEMFIDFMLKPEVAFKKCRLYWIFNDKQWCI